jgi:hypothetical protein
VVPCLGRRGKIGEDSYQSSKQPKMKKEFIERYLVSYRIVRSLQLGIGNR